MAFGRRNTKSESDSVPALGAGPSTLRPVSPPADTTFVDASSEFSGSLRMNGDVQIDGSVEGEIECRGTLTVGDGGRVQAQVRAECVVIFGEVHGDIEASSEITLHKTARVFGDMNTEGIVIEKGAKVEGRITIGSSSESGARASASSAHAHAQPQADSHGSAHAMTQVLDRAKLDT